MADYKKSSVHCHSTMCDGRNTLQEMASAACAQGLTTLGFSGHSYTQRDREYCMSPQPAPAQYKATIAKLKAEIVGLKQELSEYKSVRSKLRTSDLERENAGLRGKVQRYEDVIQRNNLWHFSVHAEKKRQCGTMPADAVLS